jgi:UDP-glucose 4-epimerase
MVASLNKRVVILGAAGFIGFHLSRKIQEIEGVKLVLVDNFVRGNSDDEFNALLDKQNIQFVNKDLSLLDSYIDFFQENDIVINCAALNGTQNFYNVPVQVVRNSAMTAILAAEFAAQASVAKYFYFGSAESYAGGVNLGLVAVPTTENVPLVIEQLQNTRWSYAASKTMGEIATFANVKQYGLNAKIFRVHNIYGPRMGLNHAVPDLVKNFTAGNFGVHGVNETRAFMYIDDLVSVVLFFIFDYSLDDNLVYHIGSSNEIKIQDLAELILVLLKINEKIIPLPNLEGSVLRRVPDTTQLKKRFKFIETELAAGINNYIQWFEGRK